MRSALAIVFLLASAACHADCIDEASKYHHVHPYVLRAIAFQESHMSPAAINRNSDNSTDFGLMGINSIHLPELDRYGVKPHQLFDPCVNAYVAAWYLHQKMARYGNTWRAVGAYHSETPQLGAVYAAKIKKIVQAWGVD